MNEIERTVKEWVISVANKTLTGKDVDRLISKLQADDRVIAEGVINYDGISWVLVPIKCSKTMGGIEFSKFYKKLEGTEVILSIHKCKESK